MTLGLCHDSPTVFFFFSYFRDSSYLRFMIEFKPQLVQIYQCSLSLRTDKTRVQATCRQGCSDWAFSGEMFSKCCNSIYWLLYDAYLQHILKYTTVITVLRLKALFFLNGSGNPRHGLPFWSGPRNSDLPKLKLCTIPIPVARLQVRVREYTSSSIQNPIILSTKLHNTTWDQFLEIHVGPQHVSDGIFPLLHCFCWPWRYHWEGKVFVQFWKSSPRS